MYRLTSWKFINNHPAPSAAAERRAKFSCTIVRKSLIVDVNDVEIIMPYDDSVCDISKKGSTWTFSAAKCPGCEVGTLCSAADVDWDGQGDVTFLLPPASLGCSQAEIDEAIFTSCNDEESSMTQLHAGTTSTETSTGLSTVHMCVTGTSGATTRATNICIGAIALVGAAFTMM